MFIYIKYIKKIIYFIELKLCQRKVQLHKNVDSKIKIYI